MKAIICEFPWQMDYIKSDTDSLLVSINPEMSYELNRRGLRYRECSEFCKHEELWALYPEFVHNFSHLTTRLDEILWYTDSRFQDLNLNIFDRLGYILMAGHNQSIYYAHLTRVIMDMGVDTICCADNNGPLVDQNGMFASDKSIIPEVIRAFGNPGVKIEIQIPHSQPKPEKPSLFPFGQPIQFSKNLGAENVYNAFCNIKYEFIARMKGMEKCNRVLSVGCKEVDSLDSMHLHNTRLIKYHPSIDYNDCRDEWPNLDIFLRRVIEDDAVNHLLSYRGANLTSLIQRPIRFLAEKLEFVLNNRKKIYGYFDRQCPNLVIFQTMAPFYFPNVIAYEWCQERRIPYACWMHGGYGAYESLQGYDVSDYRLSPRHIVYGQILANLPRNANWILHTLGYADRLKSMQVMGSPFFEKLYSNYKRPDNPRKKILFSLGSCYTHNWYYFGHNRPNSELSVWNAHKRIIEVLAEYQDKFDIIIKDYPHAPQGELWCKLLKDLKATQIQYIRSERPFHELLIETDLHVFSWVSTTFFQSMYTDADICLFDDADLTKESRNIFNNHLVFNSDLDAFCINLREFLEAGKFYTQDKTFLREQFINWRDIGRREEQFESFVNTLT